VIITFTWKRLNPKPGFISAWEEARNFYGHSAFDALPRNGQINVVRAYVNR
jgi:hypothetical protein